MTIARKASPPAKEEEVICMKLQQAPKLGLNSIKRTGVFEGWMRHRDEMTVGVEVPGTRGGHRKPSRNTRRKEAR
jgi:hypothetical protein